MVPPVRTRAGTTFVDSTVAKTAFSSATWVSRTTKAAAVGGGEGAGEGPASLPHPAARSASANEKPVRALMTAPSSDASGSLPSHSGTRRRNRSHRPSRSAGVLARWRARNRWSGASRRVDTMRSRRNSARCCETVESLRPRNAAKSPTECSPSTRRHRIISRCRLPISLSISSAAAAERRISSGCTFIVLYIRLNVSICKRRNMAGRPRGVLDPDQGVAVRPALNGKKQEATMANVVVLGAGLGGTLMAYELLPMLSDCDRLTVVGQGPSLPFRAVQPLGRRGLARRARMSRSISPR